MEGKVALVTGSTSGIGLAIARRLASSGCDVIFSGLAEQSRIDELLFEFRGLYKGNFTFVGGDFRHQSEIEKLCGYITRLYPNGVDILINNAGFQYVARVGDYPVDTWNDMVAVHLTAAFLLTRHFMPYMERKGWGRIVSTSSQMGLISSTGKAPYSAVKAGLIGFTKGIALEGAPHGVTCNCICPGYVETELLQEQIKAIADRESIPYDEARHNFFSKGHPTTQPVSVEQVASLVGYLCSTDASSVTGTAVSIDGGNTAR